jgi:molybdopterin-guanine dinucleotide biosynthesis protein A
MKERHHKHPPLKRPKIGFYHRNEWALYGTTCASMNQIYYRLAHALKPCRLAYVDADHSQNQGVFHLQIGKKNFLIPDEVPWNKYDDSIQSQSYDAVIVNGNHYPATKQIVIIDPKKKESLNKRKDQLTNIIAVVKPDGEEIYDFVKDKMTGNTLILKENDHASIAEIITESISSNLPPIKALVLAGGKSLRMGEDKSNIIYHKKPQQIHIAELCNQLGLTTFISKQIDYQEDSIDGFPVIKDRMEGMGPFGAIMSAMMQDPEAAWLVLACDLPYLNTSSIIKLISERNVSKYATAYQVETKDFPEPLITIYEPRSYRRFLSFLSIGYACPRKVLINSDIHTIPINDETIASNVNTPEEKEKALGNLKTIDE